MQPASTTGPASQEGRGIPSPHPWLTSQIANQSAVVVSVVPSSCAPVMVNGTGVRDNATLYLPNRSVEAYAPPCSGHIFDVWYWSGNSGQANHTSQYLNLTVQGQGSLAAIYGLDSDFTVTANVTPTSGVAPLVVTATATAKGGTPPYAFVWTGWTMTGGDGIGPGFGTVYGNGAMTSLTIPWGGPWFILVRVNDSAGHAATAYVPLNLTGHAPLTVTAPDDYFLFGFQLGSLTLCNNVAAPLATTIAGGAPPYQVDWTFGDGTTGTSTPTGDLLPGQGGSQFALVYHVYSSSGTYTLSVSAVDSTGATSPVESYSFTIQTCVNNGLQGSSAGGDIEVANPSGPGVDLLSSNAFENLTGYPMTYTYAWQTAPGPTVTNPADPWMITQFAPTSGNESVFFNYTVTNSAGATVYGGGAGLLMNVPAPMSATGTLSPLNGTAPLTVNFTTSATGGGGTYEHLWLFGDGEASSDGLSGGGGSTFSGSHTFSRPGNYTVTMLVVDQLYGTQVSKTWTVRVLPGTSSPPTVSLRAVPWVVSVGQPLTLVLGAKSKNPVTWSLSGLPGPCKTVLTTSLAAALVCVPNVPAQYTINATALASTGLSSTKSLGAYVLGDLSSGGSLVASFPRSPNSVLNGSTLDLALSVSGGSPPYQIAYTGLPPGCSTANSATLTCTPTRTGLYEVVANATDTTGARYLTSELVDVSNSTSALCGCQLTVSGALMPGQAIRFNVSSVGTPPTVSPFPADDFAWGYGDGTGHAEAGWNSSSHSYSTGGVFDVAAMVVNRGESSVSWVNLTISLTTSPLSGLAVNPPTQSLLVQNAAGMVATPSCIGGACPSGITYSWSLSNKLATLNASTGNPVLVTAGSTPGSVVLFVNATLGGTTKGASATLTIRSTPVPPLTSVSVSMASGTVLVGKSLTLAAEPSCSSACPSSGIQYSWSLSTPSKGSLSATSGPATTFTAGSKTGTVVVTLAATLNGVTKWANATLTIQPKPSSSFLGLPGYDGYLLIGAVVGAVLVAIALLARRNRGPSLAASNPEETPKKDEGVEDTPNDSVGKGATQDGSAPDQST